MHIPAGRRAETSAAIATDKEDEIHMRASMRHMGTALVFVILCLGLAGCGKLKDDLPALSTSESQVHETGWNDQSSTNFHGAVLKTSNYNYTTCVKCHAKSFGGGTSGVGCYSCHTSFPHQTGWSDTASSHFHGKFLLLGLGPLTGCAKCHGTAYDGGTSGVSCYSCHASYPHKTGWLDPSVSGSHGKYLKSKSWHTSECVSCHGASFTGGTSGKGCFTCHATYPHTVFAAASGHSGYLYTQGYPLTQCKTCHGTSYTGGSVVNISCLSSGCHVDNTGAAKSPEACNVCHGQFRALASDALSAAPPKGVLGDSLASTRAVGAHAKHLVSGSLGKRVKCAECHSVPATLLVAGHIDTQLPAEVSFTDTLARLTTGSGTYVPAVSYNATTLTCKGTYCHGNWLVKKSGSPYDYIFTDSVMTGNANSSIVWTGGSTAASCSTCHALPPSGHLSFPLTSCVNCHPGVVNGSGQIVNQALHMNGKANTIYGERAF